MTYLSKGLTKPSFSNSKMSSHMTESGRDKYCEHPVSPARQAGGQGTRMRRAPGSGSSSAAGGSCTQLVLALHRYRRAENHFLLQWHCWTKGDLSPCRNVGWSSHCCLKLLLEFPTSALLSSSQLTRRWMAMCLSEEDLCWIVDKGPYPQQPPAAQFPLQLTSLHSKFPPRKCRPHPGVKALDGAQLVPPPGCLLPRGRCARNWGQGKVSSSGFAGEILAISFFPATSNLSSLQRKNYTELQPRQNRGRKHFKDFLLYNILCYWGLLSHSHGALCVFRWRWQAERPRWQNKHTAQLAPCRALSSSLRPGPGDSGLPGSSSRTAVPFTALSFLEWSYISRRKMVGLLLSTAQV